MRMNSSQDLSGRKRFRSRVRQERGETLTRVLGERGYDRLLLTDATMRRRRLLARFAGAAYNCCRLIHRLFLNTEVIPHVGLV